ncbi:sigma-70 family RNA polymerase sigma factor [Oceanobacillus massiliensis]|uniref:sigma-70 family RNA polymerase sigma factor n=1 Tax=Oceanobacillus massiliensis TaxID=1465765 RepID=UPI00028A2452|nr:sigma-70 family RNA polymerase sigma factor [Oceanobacillus massiliensis]
MEKNIREENILEIPKEEIINFIINSYGEELKRIIFTYVKNHSQTDDIFQEVLIKTYKGLDKFRGDSSLKTWLYRISINKCKDYLRSPIHRLIPHNLKAIREEKTLEQSRIEEEQQNIVAEAILSLPIKYREVIVLRYYKDLSIKEISQALNTNESTIKTRIQRGKKNLKKNLGGYEIE